MFFEMFPYCIPTAPKKLPANERKLRKELFGKGPERIHTVFVENMAVSTLYENPSASEQFIARHLKEEKR